MSDDGEELEEQMWHEAVLNEITDEHAVVLDLSGWKIVSKDDPAILWPFLALRRTDHVRIGASMYRNGRRQSRSYV